MTAQQHCSMNTLGMNKSENVCTVWLCYLMMMSAAKMIYLHGVKILVQLRLSPPYRHVWLPWKWSAFQRKCSVISTTFVHNIFHSDEHLPSTLDKHEGFHVCYCCLISGKTETYWQVYWSCQISWKFMQQFSRCYINVTRDKTKLTGTFLNLFTVDLQNGIPYFPLHSRMQAEMPEMQRQHFPNLSARRPLLALKSNHGSSHIYSRK